MWYGQKLVLQQRSNTTYSCVPQRARKRCVVTLHGANNRAIPTHGGFLVLASLSAVQKILQEVAYIMLWHVCLCGYLLIVNYRKKLSWLRIFPFWYNNPKCTCCSTNSEAASPETQATTTTTTVGKITPNISYNNLTSTPTSKLATTLAILVVILVVLLVLVISGWCWMKKLREQIKSSQTSKYICHIIAGYFQGRNLWCCYP